MTDVAGDDDVGPATHGGDHHVAVIGVGECHRVLQVLPSVERVRPRNVVHVGESPLDLFGWDVGMDLYDGVGGSATIRADHSGR